MANVRVTAGGDKAAFFGDFLCSSKESYPRPAAGGDKAAFFGDFLCSSKESYPRPGEGQC